MREFPSNVRLASTTTPVAFGDWYELAIRSAEGFIRRLQLAHSRSKFVIFASRLRATARASELP